jgi:hypothetical protein
MTADAIPPLSILKFRYPHLHKHMEQTGLNESPSASERALGRLFHGQDPCRLIHLLEGFEQKYCSQLRQLNGTSISAKLSTLDHIELLSKASKDAPLTGWEYLFALGGLPVLLQLLMDSAGVVLQIL